MKETSGYVKSIIILLILTGIFSSCVPRKKLLYLQTSDEDTITGVVYPKKIEAYILKPGNSLHIRILSTNSDLSTLGNSGAVSSSQDAGVYLQSFPVNDSGYVFLPLVGNVMVNGKTIEEATIIIQERLDKILKGTSVVVKLVDFNISVLGEVNHPIQLKIYQEKINLFEAISLAGDLTSYAKRDEVLLIRQNDKGSNVISLNLQDPGIFESEYYYLKPGDIVYAKPIKGRSFIFETFPYTIVFGTITTILLILNLFK